MIGYQYVNGKMIYVNKVINNNVIIKIFKVV